VFSEQSDRPDWRSGKSVTLEAGEHRLEINFRQESGEAVARLFATNRQSPDAIFCGNDQIARGMADALRERGIAVPGEVAIVGFDNWEIIAAATRPPLTTIDMNLTELGREAGRRLIGMIAGDTKRGVHRLPCSLIVRESCGCAEPLALTAVTG